MLRRNIGAPDEAGPAPQTEMRSMKMMKVLAVAGLALVATACASKKDGADAGTGVDNGMNNGAVTGGALAEQLRAVGDTVYFDLDSYQVRTDGAAILQQQAQILNANPEVMVRIEGHADERGTREYNIALGDRRANAVKETLVSYGIDRNRISTISYGKDQPICGEASESCYAQNRRATTAISASGM
jgi:peptidoglycan-associated lipoprotein